ncbi:MAG: dihydrolipoamide acetyltransferase [Streptosporangiaceae bacterium]|nr:dihydrolipoamide acetyltransferase [Streptosporangiaceae bacterium]
MSEILMPRLSDTMEEGVVSSWQKKPGDTVAVGDVLVDIETDKAVMEYEAYEAGVLEKILVGEGETASIGATIAILATNGATSDAPASSAPEQKSGTEEPEPERTAEASAAPGTEAKDDAPVPAAGRDAPRSRPPSSPLARKIAKENGIDLGTLAGSGPGGRVVRADVEAALRTPASTVPESVRADALQGQGVRTDAAAEDPDTEKVPLNRFRKVTARRLAESMSTAPHIYLTRHIDMEELLAFRATLNTALAPAKVSVNDLVVKACATALREHPALNVSFTEDYLLMHKRVHVGVAVAIDDGLLVPVIRDADRKSVSQIGAETRDLAARAREKRLTAQEMSGGTFSVSNMGMLGVDAFTAVINPPEAAILAVGAIREEAVIRDGAVVPRHRMTITLSVDHRACDGATGATFLGRLAELLENPLRIVA